MDFSTVMNNPDGSAALPISDGMIDWDKIPTAKPPDGFVAPVAVYRIDPFMCGDEEEKDEFDKLQEWIGSEGAECESAEEFLLKATAAFGCDEEWFSTAASRGFPLASALQNNPYLVADLITSTKVFDWAVNGSNYLGFWNLKRSMDHAVGALNTPPGTYAVMEAYFAKALRAKSRESAFA